MRSITGTIVDLGTGRKLHHDRLPSEKDYDRLVIDHKDLLAELLFEADAMREGTELMYLGTQVLKIDVLFAEVTGEERDFSRLVLVENKLLKNPEAQRSVVAQIIEYAAAIRDDVDLLEAIGERIPKDQQEWFDANRDAIEHCLAKRDFLLVISGDEIHENVQRIVKSFSRASERDPLLIADLCLVSWAIFKDAEGGQRILVPNLVGVVTEAERQVTIRVKVELPDGKPLPAKLIIEEDGPVKYSRATEEEFFNTRWLPAFGKEAVDAWATLAKTLEGAGIRGFQILHSPVGRPILGLRLGNTSLDLLRPRGKKATIVAAFRGKLWDSIPAAAGQEFRAALLGIEGANSKANGEIDLPVANVAKASSRIAEAVRRLAEVVRQ